MVSTSRKILHIFSTLPNSPMERENGSLSRIRMRPNHVRVRTAQEGSETVRTAGPISLMWVSRSHCLIASLRRFCWPSMACARNGLIPLPLAEPRLFEPGNAMATPPSDKLTERIINLAIEVHRNLGPGLLESTYGECLSWELTQAGLEFARQVQVPVVYKGQRLAAVYRLDFVINDRVVVEIKATEKLAPVHEAQLLTYLRHTGIPVGLLLNFNTAVLKDGLRRLGLHRALTTGQPAKRVGRDPNDQVTES